MLTKAKLSAEALAAIFEQSVDCVKLVDVDGNVIWMNENGLCLMDVSDFALINGQKWSSFWPDNASDMVASGFEQAMSGKAARFQAACPTMAGTPKFWDVTISAVTDEDKNPVGCLAISRDITEADLSKRKLEISVAEMRHRVRNTYAMIGGLLSGFARGNPEHQQFARDMGDRLVSICAAQTLFATDEDRCQLRPLIEALAAPFDGEQCEVIIGDIPNLTVDRDSADAVALVLGELAVNASKHGALASGGSIRIDARIENSAVEICWHEEASAAVKATRRDGGQGLTLTRKIVEIRGGSIDVEWFDKGLKTTLRLPL